MHKIKRQFINGFSIVEILVVIVVIGILSTISVVSYVQVQHRAIDSSVDSDIQRMDIKQLSYKYNSGTLGKAYNSLNGIDADLNFTPISGNVINVAVNSSGYCIRGYNTKGTKNSIDNAYIKESVAGICSTLAPTVGDPVNPNAPSIPTLTASNPLATSINLSWTTITSAINYVLQRDTNSSFTTATQIASQSGTTFTSSGLSQATLYYYRVNVTTASGVSAWSETASATTSAITIPTLTATTASSTSINLSWTAITGATNYVLQRDTNSSFTSATQIASQAGTAFTTSSLSQGIQYYFRVNATTAGGTSDWSTSANATTTITTPSAQVIATPATSNSTTTTWTWGAVSCPGNTTRYRYDYFIDTVSQSPSGWKTPSVPTATSIAFTTSTENHTYAIITQAQCYSALATSDWSTTSNNVSYFRPIANYTLTISAGAGGTVNTAVNGSYTPGTTPTITATPDGIHTFSSWSGSAGCSGVVSHTITMDANKSCTANFALGSNWVAGVASTPLAGKYVMNINAGSTYSFVYSYAALGSPYAMTGLDPNYPSSMVLVSPQTYPDLDFSAYYAQNICKYFKGRLPNTQELSSMYTNKASYGNNFNTSGEAYYWTATEYAGDPSYAYAVDFSTGGISYAAKTYYAYVRCVAD